MKALVVFYSFTGNTKKLASVIQDFLTIKGIEVEFLELKLKTENKSFIRQASQALRAKRVALADINIVYLKEYDYIFLGTPVWAFAPAPALRSFIADYAILKDKEISLFATYGSGLGKDKCFDKIEKMLSEKNCIVKDKIMVSDKKVNDKQYLLEVISNIVKI